MVEVHSRRGTVADCREARPRNGAVDSPAIRRSLCHLFLRQRGEGPATEKRAITPARRLRSGLGATAVVAASIFFAPPAEPQSRRELERRNLDRLEGVVAEVKLRAESAATLLEATITGVWVVREAAVQVLARTPGDAPCREEWRQLAARGTEVLWPYVADWSKATAETASAAAAGKVAAAVADRVAEVAESRAIAAEESKGSLFSRIEELSAHDRGILEANETADRSLTLVESLSAGVRRAISETVGCVERGGLTWEEWVEAEAAGKGPARPPAEQEEALETVRKSGIVA